MSADNPRVAGVDGCSKGWIAVFLDGQGRFTGARFAAELAEITADRSLDVIAVDIPMGSVASGRRQADAEARAFLRPHASRVFTPPPLDVLAHEDYAAANAACREHYGFGMSKQAWELRKKILEADPLWGAEPDRIREIHPEVSFQKLAGRPLASKKKWTGLWERLTLLEREGIHLPRALGEPSEMSATDDVVDAAIAAWSALRVVRGDAASLPTHPERDDAARPVAIWY